MKIALLISVALLTPQAAIAQGDEATRSASEMIDAGQADAAYDLLAPMASSRAGDPAFDLLLGIAAVESGRSAEAIVALQRVLALQPNNGRAQVELARAYANAGDIDTARAEFRNVLSDPTVPEPVRRRIDGLVSNLDRQAGDGGVEISGYFDAEVGFDSNINAATDSTSITLPIFAFLGPAALNNAATQQDDGFYQLQGGLSVYAPLSRQTRLFVSGLANWRDNFDFDFVDQASVLGTAGIAHNLLNGDAISFSGQAQQLWLDENSYRSNFGATAQYTKRLGNNRALAFSAQYYRLNFDNQPLMDANRFAGAVTYSDQTIYAGLTAGKEETARTGADHLSHAFVNGQIGGELRTGPRIALIGGISVEYRSHDGQDPLFLQGREDIQFNASAGLRYRIADHVSVRPRVTYTANESNLPLYDYDRFTASVGLRFEF